jgi:hypothetical protein
MPAICPFCALENPSNALVCGSCGRDIAVPASLIAERDDLARKREAVQEELRRARGELDILKRNKNRRSV